MLKCPYIPTKELVFFPHVTSTLYVGRPFSVNGILLSSAEYDSKIILSLQKVEDKKSPKTIDDVHKYGIIAKIKQILTLPDNTYKVLIEGVERVLIKDIEKKSNQELTGTFIAEYEVLKKPRISKKTELLLMEEVKKVFKAFNEVSKRFDKTVSASILEIEKLDILIDTIAAFVNFSPESKIKLLEAVNLKDRTNILVESIKERLDYDNIEKEIEEKVRFTMSDAQRQYYLREKLRVIREELNDKEITDDETMDLFMKLKTINIPADFKKKLEKEILKLDKIPDFSAEASVVRTYIETVFDLPWDDPVEKDIEITKAKEILDEDHYGLKEVKDAILEYLAVRELNKQNKDKNKNGTILCLIGPPGVGKTSFASSIAHATEREFARISLGGVNDESEIRGHRRTYVGSMPGRIIDAIKRAGVKNPIILLDEIDKLDSNFKGDPAAALLEVLDPAQNSKFEDHYIDFPYDLSNVFFICTANDVSNIPRPLLDRMEVIYLDSYTEFEKINIATRYLVPQALEETGMKEIEFSNDILLHIINMYTREAGVRNLKREILKICRKIARIKLESKSKKKKYKITNKNISEYLGPEKFKPEKISDKKPKVGSVTGLAWTSVGGTTLEVQAVKMEGKGTLLLTGKLGEVMRESVQVAYSYVRSIKNVLKIKEKFNETSDIHIHFPEGAVPKDGPSAGITITTALISVIANKKVRQDIAMTGEITISGDVLPVGGIKEKVIGAHRIGIREVIVPYDNIIDTKELPEEIKDIMKFHFVKNYLDVIKLVFEK